MPVNKLGQLLKDIILAIIGFKLQTDKTNINFNNFITCNVNVVRKSTSTIIYRK